MDQQEMWAVVELMGHRKLAGRVCEEVKFGAPMMRLDVPCGDDGEERFVTQFYHGSSIYCLTPTTEDVARAFARGAKPRPVEAYELRLPGPPRVEEDFG